MYLVSDISRYLSSRYVQASQYFCIAFQRYESVDMVEILSKISYASNSIITFFCVDKYNIAVHICSKGFYKDD